MILPNIRGYTDWGEFWWAIASESVRKNKS